MLCDILLWSHSGDARHFVGFALEFSKLAVLEVVPLMLGSPPENQALPIQLLNPQNKVCEQFLISTGQFPQY